MFKNKVKRIKKTIAVISLLIVSVIGFLYFEYSIVSSHLSRQTQFNDSIAKSDSVSVIDSIAENDSISIILK